MIDNILRIITSIILVVILFLFHSWCKSYYGCNWPSIFYGSIITIVFISFVSVKLLNFKKNTRIGSKVDEFIDKIKSDFERIVIAYAFINKNKNATNDSMVKITDLPNEEDEDKEKLIDDVLKDDKGEPKGNFNSEHNIILDPQKALLHYSEKIADIPISNLKDTYKNAFYTIIAFIIAVGFVLAIYHAPIPNINFFNIDHIINNFLIIITLALPILMLIPEVLERLGVKISSWLILLIYFPIAIIIIKFRGHCIGYLDDSSFNTLFFSSLILIPALSIFLVNIIKNEKEKLTGFGLTFFLFFCIFLLLLKLITVDFADYNFIFNWRIILLILWVPFLIFNAAFFKQRIDLFWRFIVPLLFSICVFIALTLSKISFNWTINIIWFVVIFVISLVTLCLFAKIRGWSYLLSLRKWKIEKIDWKYFFASVFVAFLIDALIFWVANSFRSAPDGDMIKIDDSFMKYCFSPIGICLLFIAINWFAFFWEPIIAPIKSKFGFKTEINATKKNVLESLRDPSWINIPYWIICLIHKLYFKFKIIKKECNINEEDNNVGLYIDALCKLGQQKYFKYLYLILWKVVVIISLGITFLLTIVLFYCLSGMDSDYTFSALDSKVSIQYDQPISCTQIPDDQWQEKSELYTHFQYLCYNHLLLCIVSPLIIHFLYLCIYLYCWFIERSKLYQGFYGAEYSILYKKNVCDYLINYYKTFHKIPIELKKEVTLDKKSSDEYKKVYNYSDTTTNNNKDKKEKEIVFRLCPGPAATSTNATSTNATSTNGTSTNGTSTNGTSTNGTSTDGTSTDGTLTFRMGIGEKINGRKITGRMENSMYPHDVKLTPNFWMMETPVTVGMFKAFVKDTGYASTGIEPQWARNQHGYSYDYTEPSGEIISFVVDTLAGYHVFEALEKALEEKKSSISETVSNTIKYNNLEDDIKELNRFFKEDADQSSQESNKLEEHINLLKNHIKDSLKNKDQKDSLKIFIEDNFKTIKKIKDFLIALERCIKTLEKLEETSKMNNASENDSDNQTISIGTLNKFNIFKTLINFTEKISWDKPGFEQKDNHPVTCVSWYDAMAFCAWLSIKIGCVVTLPTEAQWEFACRAGTKTLFYYNKVEDKDNANNVNNVEYVSKIACCWDKDHHNVGTKEVKTKAPNFWGLYDMSGNVWEWCLDCYENPGDVNFNMFEIPESWKKGNNKNGTDQKRIAPDPYGDNPVISSSNERVVRGGRWFSVAIGCCSADRDPMPPEHRENGLGFRCIMIMPEKAEEKNDVNNVS